MVKKGSKSSTTPMNGATATPSPYFEPPRVLSFENNVKAHIHPQVLAKSPALAARSNPFANIDAAGISPEVGHVIVHFLYVGRYGRLEPRVESPEPDIVAELTTAIRVYLSTPLHEMPTLEDLAKDEIEKLADKLSLGTLFDVVEDIYPISKESDIWFPAFLARRIRLFTANLTREEVARHLEELAGARTLTKILLKNIVELRQHAMDATEQSSNSGGNLGIGSAKDKDDRPTEGDPTLTSTRKLESETPLESEGFLKVEQLSGGVNLAEAETVASPPAAVCSGSVDDNQVSSLVPEPAPAHSPTLEQTTPKKLTKKERKKMMKAIREAKKEAKNAGLTDPVDPPPRSPMIVSPNNTWSFVDIPFVNTTQNAVWPRQKLDPDLFCESRAEHLTIGGGWKDCQSCRELVQQFSMEV